MHGTPIRRFVSVARRITGRLPGWQACARHPARTALTGFATVTTAHRHSVLIVLAALTAASPALCAEAVAPATRPVPLISLLLPLDAREFAPAAGAVRSGCDAALALENTAPGLEVVRTDAGNARVVEGWLGAASRQARVIIGPMTRSGTSALAAALSARPASSQDAPVTLALNLPEEAVSLPARFYTFGLSAEPEARAVARLAWIEGQRTVVVVQARGALERRMSQAFADEWLAYGGRIIDIRDVNEDTDLEQLRTQLAKTSSDFVFLSGDAAMARRVRPYLNSASAIYATSQVNDGRNDPGANVDLEGIRFTDMPWMVQPDHPAVMVYARPANLAPGLQRFYALGIDACRIAVQVIAGRDRIDLDGVTGHLTLDLAGAGINARAVSREPLSATFRSNVDNAPPKPAEEAPAAPPGSTAPPVAGGQRPEPALAPPPAPGDMRR